MMTTLDLLKRTTEKMGQRGQNHEKFTKMSQNYTA
jgi:hypothetical protein